MSSRCSFQLTPFNGATIVKDRQPNSNLAIPKTQISKLLATLKCTAFEMKYSLRKFLLRSHMAGSAVFQSGMFPGGSS